MAQQDVAAQHVTSVVLARKWTQVIYNLQGTPPRTCPPMQRLYRDEANNPVLERTLADCVEEKLTTFMDNSTRGEYVLADGRRLVQTVSPPARRGTTSVRTVELVYTEPGSSSSGDRLSYSLAIDNRGTIFTSADDITTVAGKVEFSAQPSATFEVTRSNPEQTDSLRMTLSDGAGFTLRVPIGMRGGSRVPNFFAVTTGTYQSEDGPELQFELRGADENARTWSRWNLTKAPDGQTGVFTLNPDFSGNGQFYRDGRIDAAVSFSGNGEEAAVTLVGERDATTAGPSAAALAFLLHAWRELAATGAPRPGT